MDEQALRKEMNHTFVVFSVVIPYWGFFTGVTLWGWMFDLGFAALKVLTGLVVVAFIYALARFDTKQALLIWLRGFLMSGALIVAFITTMIVGAVAPGFVGL